MKPLLAAGLLPLVVASQAATLFQDTFDRPDSRNIQAVATGVADATGSSLGAGTTYTQPFLDPANRSPTFGVQDADPVNGGGAQVLSNNLQLAVGAGTSNAYVNHNFTDASILSAGGFSVSLDVLGYSQTTNGQGGGFAVGMTQAEANTAVDAFSGTLRMTGGFGTAIGTAVPANNVSDFWVVIRGDNTLVWGGKTGNVLGSTGLPAKAASLAVNFRFTSFAAGSTVTYEVIADGILKGTGTFTWSDANSNFIGLDSRDAVGVTFDNFRVGTDFQQPQVFPPEVDTFEATKLTGVKDTRFHWNVIPGTVGDPVTVTVSSGATVLATSTSTTGFADVTAGSATNFTLKATNTAGSVTATATLAANNGYATAVRADAPSVWYRFNNANGGTLISDSSSSSAPHDGTIVGGLSQGQGAIDGAGNFYGNSSSILTDAVFNPATLTPGFTVEAVVRRYANSPADAAILSQVDGTGVGRSFLSVGTDGTIETFLGGGPAQRKTADAKLPSNTWAHLVMVVDVVTPEIRWYLDGVQIGSTTDGVNPDGTTFTPAFAIEAATGAWRIGTQKLANQNFWLGDIDEIAVYPTLLDDPDGNGNRSDSRVAAHSTAWLASASGLLGFSADSESLADGASTTLRVKVASNVTSVSIDNGVGAVTPVNGVATITVHPSATTTYVLTTNSPAGTQTESVTIEVTTPPQPPAITAYSLSGGNINLSFTGAPSTTYNLRGSLDLASFGIDLGTVATDASGAGTVSVPLVAGRPRQFYRLETLP